jgi:hypothetical protein
MTTPICHLTITPRPTEAVDENDHTIYKTDGTPCIGSRCAAWKGWGTGKNAAALHLGLCGLADGDTFEDPAQPAKAEPT